MTLTEIWSANQKIGDGAEARFTSGMSVTEKRIYALLKQVLKEFDVKDGAFVGDEKASAIINKLKRAIPEILSEADLLKQVNGLLSNFEQIAANTAKAQQNINGIIVTPSIITNQQAFAIDQTLFKIREANVNLYFIEPLKRLLYSRVSNGTSVIQTERELKLLVEGDSQRKGVLTRWAGQVARDAVNQFEGAINQEIKTQFELTNTAYIGSLVKDSRAQCHKWVDMGRMPDAILVGEIKWALNGGRYEEKTCSGMIDTTDITNFCIYRGGYNCRHTAIGVR